MYVRQCGQSDEISAWSRKIQNIMDEMRNRSFCDYRVSGAWQPTVNVYETRARYHICVELSGVDRQTVSIQCVDQHRVVFAGQRARPALPEFNEPFSLELLEIDEGPFQREIELHEPVSVDHVELSYDKGYLWITMRKITTS